MLGFFESHDKLFHLSISENMEFQAHFHSHIEVIYIYEGILDVELDGERFSVGENQLFVVFPSQIHSYITKDYNKYLIFLCEPSFCEDYFDTFQNYLPVNPRIDAITPDNEIISSLCNIYREYVSEQYDQRIIKGYFYIILGRILAKLSMIRFPHLDYNTTQKVILYCMGNFKEELNLSKMSMDLSISKYYLSHIFNKKLHIGFSKYLNSLRISLAKQLLANTDYTITEIAYECGFKNLRTFNRVFIEICNMPPREYRKKVIPDLF